MDEHRYSDAEYFIASAAKIGSAVLMAAAPLLFIGILYQGGLGTVPVHNRAGQVIFHISNIVAASIFSWLWFSTAALIFSFSKKAVAKYHKRRDAD